MSVGERLEIPQKEVADCKSATTGILRILRGLDLLEELGELDLLGGLDLVGGLGSYGKYGSYGELNLVGVGFLGVAFWGWGHSEGGGVIFFLFWR